MGITFYICKLVKILDFDVINGLMDPDTIEGNDGEDTIQSTEGWTTVRRRSKIIRKMYEFSDLTLFSLKSFIIIFYFWSTCQFSNRLEQLLLLLQVDGSSKCYLQKSLIGNNY